MGGKASLAGKLINRPHLAPRLEMCGAILHYGTEGETFTLLFIADGREKCICVVM